MWSVGETPSNSCLQTAAEAEEPLDRTLAGEELQVSAVAIAGDELRSVGVCSRNQDRRHPEDIRSKASCGKLLNRFPSRHQYLAPQVSAFFRRGELILKMDCGRSSFNHAFHQFEGVKNSAESCFCIRNDRQHPIEGILPLGMRNLIGTHECVVDGTDHTRHAVGRIQTLVRVHLATKVRVRRNLPAAQIDGLEAGFGHLNRLISCERAKSGDIFLLVKHVPELLCAGASERMLYLNGSAKAPDIGGLVSANRPFPAG